MTDHTTLPPAKGRMPASAPTAFARLRDEIDRLFDDFAFVRPPRSIFAFAPGELTPAMELAAKDGGYELSVELPGLDENDIEVEFDDGVLTVSGEKREESESKDKGYLMSERRYGSFRRQLAVPTDVDPETIAATFRKGVLKIAMKKDAKAAKRTKKIKLS